MNGVIEWLRLVTVTFGVLNSVVIEDVAVVDVAPVLVEEIVEVQLAGVARFVFIVAFYCSSVSVTFFDFELEINLLNIITKSLFDLTFKYCNNLE